MNIQTYNVKLNMKDTGIVETGIRLKQGDSKMQFIFTIIDGGESYFDIDDLPKVCFKRPDGTTVLGTSQISENNYIYQIVGNELQIAGNVLCDVKFTLIDGRESTSTFQFDVLPDTVTNNAEGSGVYDNDLADTVQEIRDLQAEVNRVARVATDTVNEARQAVETTSDSVILAQSYAKGGTGARAGEDTDNAKYYYEKAKTVTGIGTGDLIIKQNGIYAGTFNANSMTDVEIDLLGGGGTGVVGWGSIQGDISDQTDLVQSLADIDSKIYSYVTDMEERGFYSPNMFSHSFATQTQYGITYTANDDKSITINGTSTASTPVVIGSFKFESGKSYILNGCPNVVGCSLVVGTTSYSDAGTGVTIVGDGNTYNISLSVTSGTVVTNAVVKPMIRMSDIKDDTYYPYILSNTELVNAVPTGLLPEVYITTESDATITVSNSSTSLTPTKLDATTWKVTVPSFGDWDIHSINSLGDIKQTLTVDSIKVYQITITHFTAYITVNYTAGALVTLANSGTTITATLSGQKIAVHQKGIWTVTATFDAQTSQSKTVNISTEGEEKTVTLDAFATLNVNYDAVYVGETVTLTNGTKTYTKSATSSLSVQFVVDVFGTWSVTTSKTSQSVEMPTKGTYSLTLSEGDRHIIVTYESAFEGAEITCTNGSVTKSQTASGGTIGFYFDQDGTFTISSEASGTTYTSSVVVNGAGDYNVDLLTTPDGSTVTPTDDIQTWLKCADITNKSYTTITEVLADNTTLLALVSNNNASDYLVRSTTWVSSVCANQNAMTYIGNNNYCTDKLLSDSTWTNAICGSTYYESVLNTKVPTMTSNTAPAGQAISSGHTSDTDNYRAFDGNDGAACTLSTASNCWVGYKFTTSVCVKKVYIKQYIARITKYRIDASNDGSTWTAVSSDKTDSGTNKNLTVVCGSNNTKYLYYRLYITSAGNVPLIVGLQFYGRT